MKKYSSETEMFSQGKYIIGRARKIEADKSCNDSKTLQDYMRHVKQQSHGRKTQAQTAAIHLTTLKNRASLLRVHKMLQDVRTDVRALHSDNLDRIRSRLNGLQAHLFEETLCDD